MRIGIIISFMLVTVGFMSSLAAEIVTCEDVFVGETAKAVKVTASSSWTPAGSRINDARTLLKRTFSDLENNALIRAYNLGRGGMTGEEPIQNITLLIRGFDQLDFDPTTKRFSPVKMTSITVASNFSATVLEMKAIALREAGFNVDEQTMLLKSDLIGGVRQKPIPLSGKEKTIVRSTLADLKYSNAVISRLIEMHPDYAREIQSMPRNFRWMVQARSFMRGLDSDPLTFDSKAEGGYDGQIYLSPNISTALYYAKSSYGHKFEPGSKDAPINHTVLKYQIPQLFLTDTSVNGNVYYYVRASIPDDRIFIEKIGTLKLVGKDYHEVSGKDIAWSNSQ